MRRFTPRDRLGSARIMSRRDPVRLALWAGALIVVTLAAAMRPDALPAAGGATLQPFVALAAIILGAALADRLGFFRLLAGVLVPERVNRWASVAALLAFTALLSALVNLDVAVVVAMPVALRVGRREALGAGHVAAAVALTANGASFLLPTSNVTNLLLIQGERLSALGYVGGSWLPWLLVTALTVMALSVWPGHRGMGRARAVEARLSARAAFELAPVFLAVSGIRALLGSGIEFHGPLVEKFAAGSVLASTVNNLPAAAAVRATGTPGLWAAILAMSIGPNLFITGSVATLICRRIARDAGGRLGVWRFSSMGLALVPAQFAAATLGLRIVGVLR